MKTQRQHHARLLRRDDSVIPQPCGGKIRITFLLESLADRLLEVCLFLARPVFPFSSETVALDGRQYRGRLFAAHDRYAAVGPAEQEAGPVGAPAHAVIAGPERAADDERE